MMRHVILSFAMLLTAAPASAQLHAYYEGFVRHEGKVLPATAEYGVEAGRAVATMKGGLGAFRIVYLEKEQLVRIILESEKQYFEVPVTEGGMAGSVMAEVESQLESLPPEQHKAIEEQLKMPQQASKAASAEYVMTDDMTKVLGYDCTRVNVLLGGTKAAEYWGTPSPDFKISEAERATMAGLGKALNGADAGAGAGGASRAFMWDTNQDGFPLIMRCTADTAITTHLQITKFDRKPLPKEMFKVPSGYKKLNLSMKDE
jgi:Domain of unknown function (DUF4412)